MDLSSEDSLRLNVLLANAQAVRIDEGAMRVHGLLENGEETTIQLNPNCRADQYVRRVRELLSSAVLGSPGGYPVFLKRWTRMGQATDVRLADLLKLGEPEAVVAVTGASGLTDELARRAWWVMPDSDNARRMLRRKTIVEGKMGRELAGFLVEFLPFEQEPGAIIDSVRLVLQDELIDEQTRMDIWNRGRQKSVFRIGFLQAVPDALPEQVPARADLQKHQPTLEALAGSGNPFARQLIRVLSGPGQTFLGTVEHALRRPNNQDAVVALMETIGEYFQALRISPCHYETMESIEEALHGGFAADPERSVPRLEAKTELAQALPGLADEIEASVVLAHVGESVVRSIFSRTDAIGSVMRRKLEPVFKPLSQQLLVLRGGRG